MIAIVVAILLLLILLLVTAVNNGIIICYAYVNHNSGNISASNTPQVTITFPTAFTQYTCTLSQCTSAAFTAAVYNVTLTTATFGYSNKNKDSSASFWRIFYIAIGC